MGASVTKKKKAQKSKLRKKIQPGSVLICLAGRFRGKRVVFIKMLESGLLLVTGPFAVNGVPLRRVNQRYCIGTSTKAPLNEKLYDAINDDYFKRVKTRTERRSRVSFFYSYDPAKAPKKTTTNRDQQKTLDADLVKK